MKQVEIEKHNDKKKWFEEVARKSPEIFQKIQSQEKMILDLQDENHKLKEQNRQLKELYNKSIRENAELKKNKI